MHNPGSPFRVQTDRGTFSLASKKVKVVQGYWRDPQTITINSLFCGPQLSSSAKGVSSHQLTFENIKEVERMMGRIKWGDVKAPPTRWHEDYLNTEPSGPTKSWGVAPPPSDADAKSADEDEVLNACLLVLTSNSLNLQLEKRRRAKQRK